MIGATPSVRPLPRRAYDRSSTTRASTRSASATTSSTRARMSYCGCSTAISRTTAAGRTRGPRIFAGQRLPSGGRLPGRDAVLRLRLPVPGGKRHRPEHGESAAAGVRHRQHVDRREDRVHRRDPQGDAADRGALRRCRARLPRRGGHRQRGAGTNGGAPDDRAPAPPGRLQNPPPPSAGGFTNIDLCQNFGGQGGHRTSSTGSTPKSTSWSARACARRTSARSTTGSSAAHRRSAA